MKLFYSLVFLCLFAATTGWAAAPVAAGDTATGHTRAVRILSAALCAKIVQAGEQRPLADLSGAESKALLTQLMTETMGEHMEMLTPMFAERKKNQAASEALGRDMVLRLARECSAAQGLVMRMGIAEVKDKPVVNDNEKAVLSLITTDICQRLEKKNAEHPLDKMTKAERESTFATAMQGAILAHMEDLANTYGLKSIQKQSEMERVGKKIGFMMAEQCSNYLLMLGLDSVSK
ncbi:hypothetical protein GCM10027048_33980 [Hymenobacter coalescens]